MVKNRSASAASRSGLQLLSACGTALLVLLFSYAALGKLFDPVDFRRQMLNQVFPAGFNLFLLYALPPLEILAAVLLLFRRSRFAGLWLSLFLMCAFTVYVALVLLHLWHRVPCSCGGVLGKLKWGPHLAFNIFFLLLTTWTLDMEMKERRAGDARAKL